MGPACQGEGASRTSQESWPPAPLRIARLCGGPGAGRGLQQGQDQAVVSLPGLCPERPGTFVGELGCPGLGSGVTDPGHTTWGKACASLSLCPRVCRVGVMTTPSLRLQVGVTTAPPFHGSPWR